MGYLVFQMSGKTSGKLTALYNPLHLTHLQVERLGDITPLLQLTVTYPKLSPLKNKLLYLTHVTTSPQVSTHTQTHTHTPNLT